MPSADSHSPYDIRVGIFLDLYQSYFYHHLLFFSIPCHFRMHFRQHVAVVAYWAMNTGYPFISLLLWLKFIKALLFVIFLSFIFLAFLGPIALLPLFLYVLLKSITAFSHFREKTLLLRLRIGFGVCGIIIIVGLSFYSNTIKSSRTKTDYILQRGKSGKRIKVDVEGWVKPGARVGIF